MRLAGQMCLLNQDLLKKPVRDDLSPMQGGQGMVVTSVNFYPFVSVFLHFVR